MSPEMARILVADDEASILSFVKKALTDEGYKIFTASGGKEACDIAAKEDLHLALLDLVMPDLSGMEVLKFIRTNSPSTRVMLMTAFATAETAVEAMKEGALDYLIKPFALDEMKMQVRRALTEAALVAENAALRREIERRAGAPDIIGESAPMREMLGLISRVAGTDTTVLISGESGTGKELVARALHNASARRAGPFLAVNCGAIPETLLERELFGNEKGSFTGADALRPGLLEAASEGTLLLDEIGEMPTPLQVKLLRVLEGHEFLRVGGTRPLKSRVRFLSTTNRDLKRFVAEGKFREDLFYRLNVVNIKMPPLRERGNDVIMLAKRFLERFAREKGRPVMDFSKCALKAMQDYRWPGNVRELQNVIERAVILCEGSEVTASDLALAPPQGATPGAGQALDLTGLPWREARESFEKTYLSRVLSECGGNISKAAERIGLDRTNLQDKAKKYGLRGK